MCSFANWDRVLLYSIFFQDDTVLLVSDYSYITEKQQSSLRPPGFEDTQAHWKELTFKVIMSNISINVCCSDVTTQRKHPPKKQNRKNKDFHKKMRWLEAKGYLRGKQNHNRNSGVIGGGKSPHQNGSHQKASTPPTPSVSHNRTLPHPDSACGFKTQLFGSTHSLPSETFTVNKRDDHEKPKELLNTKAQTSGPSTSSHKPCTKATGNPNKYLAIDCEMVGTGPKGSISQLARCSIVSYEGDVIYDKYINPSMPVTDYRTRWSGIRPRDLVKATPYSEARKEVRQLIQTNGNYSGSLAVQFKDFSKKGIYYQLMENYSKRQNTAA